jgi:Na+-driven multidrug efflux pump
MAFENPEETPEVLGKGSQKQVNSLELIQLAPESSVLEYFKSSSKVWEMTQNLGGVAIPIVIGQIFSLFVEMLNLIFAGHLGDPIYVQAAGIGNMYANVTCLLIIYGLNSAIATLCS